jgi:hypothetical protein
MSNAMTRILKALSREKLASGFKHGLNLYLRKYKLIFFVLFFGIGASGVLIWYYSLYYFHWTQERKDQYRSEKSKSTTLNSEGFQKVLRNLDERDRRYSSEKESANSFFAEPLKSKPK